MIEFIKDMCDSEEEFIAIGEFLDSVVRKYKNRLLYIPINLSKNSKSVNNFKELEKVISKFSHTSSAIKIQKIIDEFGGYRMYVPIMKMFFRSGRNENIINMRKRGATYIELSKNFGMSVTGIRSIVEKKDQESTK